jgi:hypothetical protein
VERLAFKIEEVRIMRMDNPLGRGATPGRLAGIPSSHTYSSTFQKWTLFRNAFGDPFKTVIRDNAMAAGRRCRPRRSPGCLDTRGRQFLAFFPALLIPEQEVGKM